METRELEVEEGKEVVRRTIVGGRPFTQHTRKISVPIGIEKLLCRAAAMPELKRGLLSNPTDTMSPFSEELSVGERTILSSIPAATLLRMIEHIDLKRHAKRQFMKAVVAATLVAGAGSAVTGCYAEGHGPMPAGSTDGWTVDADSVEAVDDAGDSE